MRSIIFIAVLLLFTLAAPAAQIAAPPFVVEYGENDKALAEASLEVLENAVADFAPYLAVGDAPIHVIVVSDLSSFGEYARNFSQVSVAGIARPHEGLIVVKPPYLMRAGHDYAGTLRHELVHVLLARNTDTRALPKWLNEGICMSLANEYYWMSSWKVAQMFLGARIIEYHNIDNVFLEPGSEMEFNDAYAQALSMTRFMRDALGEETFWRVVHGTRDSSFAEALERIAGVTAEDLFADYYGSLWSLAFLSTLTSGGLFGVGGVLVVLVWFRKRFSNQRIRRRWAAEEAEGETYATWDEVIDPEVLWEPEEEER